MKDELKTKSYFCGATLFNILVESKAKVNSNNLEIANYQILSELAKIFNDEENIVFSGNSATQQTSKYRSGAAGVPTFMGLDNQQLVAKFLDRVNKDRAVYVAKIKAFADEYLYVESENPWLVTAIFDLIWHDVTIDKTEILYIGTSGEHITRGDLPDVLEVHLPSMLLGVWCLALKRIDDRRKIKEFYSTFTVKDRSGRKNIDKSLFQWANVRLGDVTASVDEEDDGEELHDNDVLINPGVVPDLADIVNGQENFLLAFSEALQRHKGPYATYISKLYADYKNCRTFLYKIKRPFEEFYVCNNVLPRRVKKSGSYRRKDGTVVRPDNKPRPISNITVDKFMSNAVMIIGSGGLGKSMMMNHLLLDEIDSFEQRKRVPILFIIRRFKSKEEDALLHYLVNEMTKYDPELSEDNLTELLRIGRITILLDGYDEIQDEYKEHFISEIERIMLQYPKARFVLSSRNIKQLHILDRFLPYDLCPLEPEQAYEMIRKIDAPEFSGDLKERFIRDIASNRFRFNRDEKKEFLGNPLLLTIMLTTYADTNEIKTKRYLFYEDAYTVLAQRHDADKGISRAFRTGLDIREFKTIFGEFCALAFSKQEYEFRQDVFEEYLQEIIDLNKLKVTVEDFKSDIIEKLCLMFLDGNTYRWVHRSFQEYFAAFFFSLQLAQDFEWIYRVFTCYDESLHEDETLPMLYGLNRRLVESCIILPYIEDRFIKNKNPQDRGSYETFLKMFYPTIYYSIGDYGEEHMELTDWAIYNFIIIEYDLRVEVSEFDFNLSTDYATETEEFYLINSNWQNPNAKPSDEIVKDYQIPAGYEEYYGEPEIAAIECSIEVDKVFSDAKLGSLLNADGQERYSNATVELLCDNSFPLKQEYDNVIEFYYQLKEKYTKTEKESFLSHFH